MERQHRSGAKVFGVAAPERASPKAFAPAGPTVNRLLRVTVGCSPIVMKPGCRKAAAGWAERSGVPFGRVGVLGRASLSAYGSVGWLKVWRGGGCRFSATERAHKRNGGQIDAECRRPGLVTTGPVNQKEACGV